MMDQEGSDPRPCITQLRPLHTYQDVGVSSSTIREDDGLSSQLLHWTSCLKPRPDETTAIQAFVRLISRILTLEYGETYYVKDSRRGGYILGRREFPAHETITGIRYVDCADGQEIQTDFSIGSGKPLQLHIGSEYEALCLTARASYIPRAALEALGVMLDDLIIGTQRGQDKDLEWSLPSILNFPPRATPLTLLSQDVGGLSSPEVTKALQDKTRPRPLHRWFEQRATERPESTAIDFLLDFTSGKRLNLTYQEVEHAANRLAAKLSQMRERSQSSLKTVAVMIGPCPELYVSCLAALKAGLPFCPIAVDAPFKRQKALLDDLSPCAVLMTSSSVSPQVSLSSQSFSASMVDVAPYLPLLGTESSYEAASASSSVPPPCQVTEQDIAYILYTSGTTGTPKGVAVSHLSATCAISSLSNRWELTPSSSGFNRPVRWFQGAAPTFDMSILESFWTLSTGSVLCCAPREFTLQDVNKVMKHLEADVTCLTPSFASLLDPSVSRAVMLAGETVTPRLLRDYARYNPTSNNDHDKQLPRGVYNGYGPTETAFCCIAQAHVPENQRGSVIGAPLATCGVLIVEEAIQSTKQQHGLKPVPMGAVGELIVVGPQVSNVGYLKRPDETTAAFVDDDHWGRAYKTGDKARIVWDIEGQPVIEFLGRIFDDQVKLSGRRVELSEIESVIACGVADIRETLCCVWKQQSAETGSERIICLIVLEERALDSESIVQKCLDVAQHSLPAYMRPFRILQVSSIPRSTSGKSDRRAALALVQNILSREYNSKRAQNVKTVETLPGGCLLPDHQDAELEQELISVVTRAIDDSSLPDLTAMTSLAQAGVDSLRAMRILRDIRERWPESDQPCRSASVRLQPSLAVLLHPETTIRSAFFPSEEDMDIWGTSATKSARIKAQLQEFSSKHSPSVMRRLKLTNETDIEMVLPATNTQVQLALSTAVDKMKYIIHTVLTLHSDVSTDAMKMAVEQVMFSQAIYRTALLPCEDHLSPFLQATLTPEAWEQFDGYAERVVRRRGNSINVSGEVQTWLKLAEDRLSLDAHRLYHVQIVERANRSDNGLLIISALHCICDGSSLDVLINDIVRRYGGLDPVPRPGIYDAVMEWVSNTSPKTDRLWQESLKGWETEPFGTISGSNINKPPGTASQDGMVEHVVKTQWKDFESRSRALGGSPLTILQASWALLLDILSEADTHEVTFGSVLSGHGEAAHAPTFSVVPCCVAVPVTQSVRQLVHELTRNSRFARSHRHISFGTFDTLPYNTALALQAYRQPDDTTSCPVLWTDIYAPAVRYDFAMFAEVFPTRPDFSDGIRHVSEMVFKLTYRGDALSELSATEIVKQYAALTEALLASLPDDLVQTLPAQIPRDLLSRAGTKQGDTTTGYRGNQATADRVRLLHSQFEDQATLTPDLLALSFYSSRDSAPIELSYADLDSRANALAIMLREKDTDIIPICLEPSVELYVAVLAILKAGSAWCPIDTTSPIQRRTSLIARSQSQVLLTTTESFHLVEPCLAQEILKDVQLIFVDQFADSRTATRVTPRNGIGSHDICGDDMAYLLWTSGTTGEPKGVMIQHSAAAQAMQDLQVLVEHDETKPVRTLQMSASSFDVFVQDLFYTWGLAGSIVSGTRELLLGSFVDFIWKSRPTHAHLTPSFGASVDVRELRGSTLQYVTFIGEKLTEDVAEAWGDPEITTCAYNTYGPAENAVVSTMRRFHGKSRDQSKAASVGFPLDHCTAYVVRAIQTSPDQTEYWQLVPRYGVGELALGGAQVAKGYLDSPAKTAKAFIQGGRHIEERIYLTGDLVRLNDHGFEFLGRKDDLVKITGIRIELSEISAMCSTVKVDEPMIEHVETLHLKRPDALKNDESKVLVVFVSVKPGAVDAGMIRAKIFKKAKDTLPAYMVPGHVVVLGSTMPRTASNKVDRRKLQEIYEESDLLALAGREGSAKLAGGNQQWSNEQLPILQIISQNFNLIVENVSPEDSLAGLGFSSLKVTKLAWLLRQLDCQVGVVDLMRCESLGELVDTAMQRMPRQKISTERTGTAAQGTNPAWVASIRDLLSRKVKGRMRPEDTSYILPATGMQESLIFETMLEPQAYWVHRIFKLHHRHKIDEHHLNRSWAAASQRFDILRTIFVPLAQLDVEVQGENTDIVTWARQQGIHSMILQMIRDKPAIRWTTISNPELHCLGELAVSLQSELAPTTTTQPPWAITFVKASGKMMLSMHHALYDSVSSDFILDTVARLYEMDFEDDLDLLQFSSGLELGLLPTTWERQEAAASWEHRLDGLSKTTATSIFNAPFPDLTQSRQKKKREILLTKRSVPSYLLSNDSRVALPTLLQAAFGCVLASYLELDVIMLGHTVSQRMLEPDLSRVVGPVIATLPLIVRANASSSEEIWRDLTSNSVSLFRRTHHLHPVDVKKLLNRGSESSNTPFPGLFVYHPASLDVPDHRYQGMFQEESQALSLNVEHALAFNLFEEGGLVELTGDSYRISQDQLILLLDQIIDQARVMLQWPQLPLDRLSNKLNRNLLAISGEATISQADAVNPTDSISQHASEHPEWVAVEELVFRSSEDGQEELITQTTTYAQLDVLTDAIVSKLADRQYRLQPDDVVALCLHRDIKSLAATLAIFRAGYVYLPIDEDLPLARKQLLIKDAGAKLIITTRGLANDLELNLSGEPPAFLLPDGESDIDEILSWPISRKRDRVRAAGGYLLYTSGSTGQPKGVRVSNSNLCHFIGSFSARMLQYSNKSDNLRGFGKYLNLTSCAFDPHLTQLFVPLSLGYRVVIGQDRTAMLANLQEVINKLSITHFGSVPSVLAKLRLRPEDVPSVRVITTGGEKASNDLLDTWATSDNRTDEAAVLFNFYGPTETTIGCLGHAVSEDSNARNLGLPLRGLQALILRSGYSTSEPVVARKGEPGELCIVGPQVAIGYLRRPAEQAKSFQTISLHGDSNKRIYRTGDTMRMMQDGTLEFMGRQDQQAKIRGQRVELDEVVAFLRQATGNRGDLGFAACVTSSGHNSFSRQQVLFGFIAANTTRLSEVKDQIEVRLIWQHDEESTSLLREIQQKCQSGLPTFMVPTLLQVSRIPYIPASGKVDTKLLNRLAQRFLAHRQGEEDDVNGLSKARTGSKRVLNQSETVLVAAVEEVLGVSRVQLESSFQQVGIDSLSAVHLFSLLRRRGFPHIKMAYIFSPSCTIGDIAKLANDNASHELAPLSDIPATLSSSHQAEIDTPQTLDTLSVRDLSPVPEGLDEGDIEAVLPCLPLQSALTARSLVWLSAHQESNDDKESNNVPYVAQFHYRLSRNTDVNRWRKTAEQVFASEAVLRTCLIQRESDGRMFQVVLRPLSTSPFHDNEDLSDIVAQMNIRPPIRLKITHTQNSDEVLVTLRIHHALFDGVAIDVLKRRLQQGYADQGLGTSPLTGSLATLTSISRYCDLSDAQVESARQSWQAALRGVKPCRIGPHDDNHSAGVMARSTLYLDFTAAELNARLKVQSHQNELQVSASSTFQLALGLCLIHLAGQTSAVFGVVTSLRPMLDQVSDGVEAFIGPCLNTSLRTLSVRGQDDTLHELAQRIQDAHVRACEGVMPLVGVDQIQRWIDSEDKLFDSLLSINVINEDETPTEEPPPGHMATLPSQSTSDMALAVDVDIHSEGKIVITLSSAGALDETQLRKIGRLFQEIVYNCADANTRVSDVLPGETMLKIAKPDYRNNWDNLDSEAHRADHGYTKALGDVQRVVGHLLRLDLSVMMAKPESTLLYQLGLDSITVLPFVKLINKSNDTKLSSHAILKARTLKGVAMLLSKSKAQIDPVVNTGERHGVCEVASGKQRNSSNEVELYEDKLARMARDLLFIATPLQEGMLSASLATEDEAYTYTHAIQLSEFALAADTPQLDVFFTAIKDTVKACEILRTRFIFTENDDSPWVGTVSPLEQSDLVSWEVQPSPPGRVHLRIHHALYDASALQMIWRVLEANYRRHIQGPGYDDLDDQKHLYRPFAKAVGSIQRTSVAFWASLIHDYTYMPLDFPDAEIRTSSAFYFKLAEPEVLRLESRGRTLGVSIKAILQLAWAKLLCESLYGQADVVFGEVISTHDEEGHTPVVGPTINTVPMRIKLADCGKPFTVAQALSRIQHLLDDARGTVGMASLRKVQTQWRSIPGKKNVPASLFQSLFVFDGVIRSTGGSQGSQSLFKPVETGHRHVVSGADGEYPIIVSFHIKDKTMNGKIRARMTQEDVNHLGNDLINALNEVLDEPGAPVLDDGRMALVPKRSHETEQSTATSAKPDTSKSKAHAIMEVVEGLMGIGSGGRRMTSHTKLINVGLDSILAIRLSRLLKQKLGITMGVFDIMKGASIWEIATRSESPPKFGPKRMKPKERDFTQKNGLKERVAENLGVPVHMVKSVLPVLAGQRFHLEQWLHNGKRFLEPPWVYRVSDSLQIETAATYWSQLCQTHDALRTTFMWIGDAAGLVQVTLAEEWPAQRRFTSVRDLSKPIDSLINDHVHDENGKPSDLREPPVRLTVLEASDGKATVLRLHHALYDACSIKMIENDLRQLMAGGQVGTQRSLQQWVHQISDIRRLGAEEQYWKHHLSLAQDTILDLHAKDALSEASSKSALGTHFKVHCPAIVPQQTIDLLSATYNKLRMSAAIILAYAQTLERFTNCSRPTFGLHHASRSLSAADDEGYTLDLTAANIPTLTITPFSLDLASQTSAPAAQEHSLGLIQDHLAQLTRFAQSNGVSKQCPALNCYINIVYREDVLMGDEKFDPNGPLDTANALVRYRLKEHITSSYFTRTKPSLTACTIEQLDTSHLPQHQFFMNVVVNEGRGVAASISGDDGLIGGDLIQVQKFVIYFVSKLEKIVGSM